MSYKRRFTKTITVHYSGSTSYPASQNGGTTSYSGSTTETIVFDVLVDTDPFDSEVHNVNGHVDLLTSSVVATEAAHVKVIDDTSHQVGDTIIEGFFKTVQSDISQQITELKTRSEALLLQLNKLAQRCREKKVQMGSDYQRLAERYGKIFTDLNNELENGVYSLDEPVFRILGSLDEVGARTGEGDAVSTVSVTSGENAHIHSILAANLVKKQAMNAIDKGKKYLKAQYATDRVLDKCLRVGGQPATLSSPYCVMDATAAGSTIDRQVFTSPLLSEVSPDTLAASLDAKGWTETVANNEAKVIGEYFNVAVAKAKHMAQSDHERRVADFTSRLFNLSQTASPGK